MAVVAFTRGERIAAVARLHAAGMADSSIARQLGVSRTTVALDVAAAATGMLVPDPGRTADGAGGADRPVRNGLPAVPYRWRARRYPLAVRALGRAEAVHGRPGP